MTDSEKVRIPIDEIAIGVPCQFDVHDDLGSLFLMAGHAITENLKNSLIGNGSSYLEVHPSDAKSLWIHVGKDPLAATRGDADDGYDRKGGVKVRNRDSEVYCPKRAKEFQAKLSGSIEQLSDLGKRIDHLNRNDIESACGIPPTLLSMLLDDGDQAVSTLELGGDHPLAGGAGIDNQSDPLARRCAQMSMLAMNTGIEMGLDEQKLILLGQAGLLHDFGLFQMEPRLRDPTETLADPEQQTYRRHPHKTQDLLNRFMAASDATRIIVGQVHEVPDGSGYPNGLSANAIHPLAKVLSVVDGYLSLVEPGPNRLPLHPHDALAVLLYEGSRGRFDAKSLKAFLMQITLFPIGSTVQLNDATRATVVRRDGKHYASPWVRIDDGDQLTSTRTSGRSIVSPIRNPALCHASFSKDQLGITTMSQLVAVV